jgi:hypothetical protein
MSNPKDLFDYIGRGEPGITPPAENTLEENAKLLAEHHSKNIQPGHGFFFDFSNVPELIEPVYKYFIETLGWTLDYDGSFLRKPEPVDEFYYTYWEDYN